MRAKHMIRMNDPWSCGSLFLHLPVKKHKSNLRRSWSSARHLLVCKCATDSVYRSQVAGERGWAHIPRLTRRVSSGTWIRGLMGTQRAPDSRRRARSDRQGEGNVVFASSWTWLERGYQNLWQRKKLVDRGPPQVARTLGCLGMCDWETTVTQVNRQLDQKGPHLMAVSHSSKHTCLCFSPSNTWRSRCGGRYFISAIKWVMQRKLIFGTRRRLSRWDNNNLQSAWFQTARTQVHLLIHYPCNMNEQQKKCHPLPVCPKK